MTTREIAGINVEFSEDNFMSDYSQWNNEIAEVLALEEGIEILSDRHYDVISFMRKEFKENGNVPSIRKLNKASGVPTKELYSLFPGGPAKKAARIAGIKKPQGCI